MNASSTWSGPEAWARFWFRPDSGYRIALVRILTGVALVLKLTGATGLFRLGTQAVGLPKRGVFPVAEMLGGFRAPYPFLEWLPVPDAFWFARIEDALLASALLGMVGFFTRFAMLLLAVLYSYVFFLSQFQFYHHTFFLLIMVWILAVSPCNAWLSLDAFVGRGTERRIDVCPVRMVQVLVTLIYISAFLWKLNQGWFDGSVVASLREAGVFRGSFADLLLRFAGDRGVAWLTLALEGGLPVALWMPRTRMAALVVGVLLHVGIDLTMHVNSFGYQMIAAYPAFFRPGPKARVSP